MIPREIDLFEALVPTLLFAFVLAAVLLLLLDWVLVRYRLYRYLWYPALFRLSLFLVLFSLCGLWIY